MAADQIHSLRLFVNDDGKVDITDENREAFRWLFLRHVGFWITLTVKRFREKRSNPQNGYYWAVVIPMIAEQMGEEGKDGLENVHDLMKQKFNSKVFVGKDDQEEFVPQSTSKLDTKQFSDYLEMVRRWAASFLDLNIPDPTRVHGVEGQGI